jgi:hypothetical protein
LLARYGVERGLRTLDAIHDRAGFDCGVPMLDDYLRDRRQNQTVRGESTNFQKK